MNELNKSDVNAMKNKMTRGELCGQTLYCAKDVGVAQAK